MFIKIGMDSYDICNLLNVSTRAIEQQRYRIKKKLKIAGNLDDYIAEL
jgi:DNA-binding CsgD family transcriptional regulator